MDRSTTPCPACTWATVSVTGYYPATLFLNLSGAAPQLDVGVVALVAFTGYLQGQISIAPWDSLTSEYPDGSGPDRRHRLRGRPADRVQ